MPTLLRRRQPRELTVDQLLTAIQVSWVCINCLQAPAHTDPALVTLHRSHENSSLWVKADVSLDAQSPPHSVLAAAAEKLRCPDLVYRLWASADQQLHQQTNIGAGDLTPAQLLRSVPVVYLTECSVG